jgi:hypothetical protein
MSAALDKLREVMSARHDLQVDYDTDALSVTSTNAGSVDDFYEADCIIAEKFDGNIWYLIKWENYPLNE